MWASPHAFHLPNQLLASAPPEMRGIARDEVRLLVMERNTDRIHHAIFHELGRFLNPGDLLVFNNSRTLPAVMVGTNAEDGSPVEVRLTERLPDSSWYALVLHANPAASILFGEKNRAEILEAHPRIANVYRLRFSLNERELLSTLYQHGQPVRYEYLSQPWDLRYYQTIYALKPGSAEMPSAGRAFTWKMLFGLKKAGIQIASITLHTGLSDFWEEGMKPENSEEEFFISAETAEKIQIALSRKQRVIAVGTSVVRALETAAECCGLRKIHGYTRLRITSETALRVVTGLLTGFHEPEASHLDLLSALIPVSKIEKEYQQALTAGYLWHEFGDLNLIL